MTIEEKAKAYDEALKRASDVKNNSMVATPQEVAELIFPQLVEFNDRKMGEAILDALMSHGNSINLLSSRGYSMEDVREWLEKCKKALLSLKGKDSKGDSSKETYLLGWRTWGNGACGGGTSHLAIVKAFGDFKLVDCLGIPGEKYILLSDLNKLPEL